MTEAAELPPAPPLRGLSLGTMHKPPCVISVRVIPTYLFTKPCGGYSQAGLFIELPRRLILGNPYPYTRMLMWYRGVCGRACSVSFLEEFFSEIEFPVWAMLRGSRQAAAGGIILWYRGSAPMQEATQKGALRCQQKTTRPYFAGGSRRTTNATGRPKRTSWPLAM